MGACSAEGVGDGLDPTGGRLGHRLRSSGFLAFIAMPAQASKTAQSLLLLAYSGCRGRFGALTPAGPSERAKQHIGRFSYRACDVAVGLAPLRLAGPDFRYTKISARPGSDFIYTNFSGGRGFPPWGRCRGNWLFSKGETTFTWYNFSTSLLILCGGDLDEVIDFQRRTMALKRSNFLSILTKIWLRFRGNGSKN